MIETLIVDNCRSFSHFEMSGLGHVNLLVGENNCGKTSLLEAIQVVASGVDPQVLWSIAARRGEFFTDDSEPGYRQRVEIDISHWFHGFGLDLDCALQIATRNAVRQESCQLTIVEAPVESQRRLFSDRSQTISTTTTLPPPGWSTDEGGELEESVASPMLALNIQSKGVDSVGESNVQQPHRLTSRGGLMVNTMRSRGRDSDAKVGAVVFVPTAGLSTASLVAMVDDLTLTDEEGFALQAMQTLDDRIERFAPKGRDRQPRIMVRLKGTNKPLPIGSLGDGVNRLLTIAVALAKSANGILLVDEIDTGLHFTTMDRMWQFVRDAAAKLNVQVFATTHSRDCTESLAVICHETPETPSRVSIQRIEKDRKSAVSYSEAEIIAVARRGLEVR